MLITRSHRVCFMLPNTAKPCTSSSPHGFQWRHGPPSVVMSLTQNDPLVAFFHLLIKMLLPAVVFGAYFDMTLILHQYGATWDHRVTMTSSFKPGHFVQLWPDLRVQPMTKNNKYWYYRAPLITRNSLVFYRELLAQSRANLHVRSFFFVVVESFGDVLGHAMKAGPEIG